MHIVVYHLLRFLFSKAVLYAAVLIVLLLVFVALRLPAKLVDDADARWQEAQAAVELASERGREVMAVIEARRSELEQARENWEKARERIEKLSSTWRRVRDLMTPWRSPDDRERDLAEARAVQGEMETRMRVLEEALQGDEAEMEALERERGEQMREVERFRGEVERRRQTEQDVKDMLGDGLRTVAMTALWIVLAIVLVPVLWKTLAYFLWARLAELARPVVVGDGGLGVMAEIREAKPAQRFTLRRGDVMLTKERYLQSSTEDARRSTKWLLDWANPLTSLASGLFLVTRIAPDQAADVNEVEVTLSCQSHATEEITVVSLLEGECLVVRPRFLAAVVFPEARRPRFRARWVFSRLQSWITLRFRYLTVEGPVTLVLAAERGVQAERVEKGVRGRRINRNLTVAYTPCMGYHSRRAETFIAYFRGANPLFDDFFSGCGWTFNQQVAGAGGSMVGRFWNAFLQGIGRIFGL